MIQTSCSTYNTTNCHTLCVFTGPREYYWEMKMQISQQLPYKIFVNWGWFFTAISRLLLWKKLHFIRATNLMSLWLFEGAINFDTPTYMFIPHQYTAITRKQKHCILNSKSMYVWFFCGKNSKRKKKFKGWYKAQDTLYKLNCLFWFFQLFLSCLPWWNQFLGSLKLLFISLDLVLCWWALFCLLQRWMPKIV